MIEAELDQPEQDGRRARGERSRAAIVDAVLALITDEGVVPQTTAVAARAGVTQRTLFRHFASLDDLLAEAIGQQSEVVAPYLGPLDRSGTVDQRIARLVAARSQLFRRIAPQRRVAVRLRPSCAVIDHALTVFAGTQRGQTERLFDSDLARFGRAERSRRIEAIDAAAGWEIWDRLERESGLEDAAITAVLTILVRGALGS